MTDPTIIPLPARFLTGVFGRKTVSARDVAALACSDLSEKIHGRDRW
jgi:hypothetical protein